MTREWISGAERTWKCLSGKEHQSFIFVANFVASSDIVAILKKYRYRSIHRNRYGTFRFLSRKLKARIAVSYKNYGAFYL
jgi:hypothetical protein